MHRAPGLRDRFCIWRLAKPDSQSLTTSQGTHVEHLYNISNSPKQISAPQELSSNLHEASQMLHWSQWPCSTQGPPWCLQRTIQESRCSHILRFATCADMRCAPLTCLHNVCHMLYSAPAPCLKHIRILKIFLKIKLHLRLQIVCSDKNGKLNSTCLKRTR